MVSVTSRPTNDDGERRRRRMMDAVYFVYFIYFRGVIALPSDAGRALFAIQTFR